ncbi:histidine kinase dimerization/phosphoacceptor domain -containing protein [Paragemmobacter straminiformis]|uniref:histidine kinase n=1 Tax=Paragemmobacter straminiformis TaxID=2045119 RepID=A0A842I3W9_9RHOB|nr:ATP-binding protein [Gemmobacter straminiformis]
MQKASRDERRAFIAIRLGSVLLPLVGAVIWGLLAWQGEVETTRRHATDNSALIGQYIERLIQTQSIVHSSVRVRADGRDDAFLRSREFHDFLRGIEAGTSTMLGIAVIDVDAGYVASSRMFPVSGQSEPRDYISAIAGGAEFFIDRVRLEPDGQDSFVIATPLQRPAGARKMMIVSAVESRIVADFLTGIAPGQGDAASIMRADGKLLIRNIPSDPMMLPPSAAIREAIKQSPAGSMVTVAASDRIKRLYAYRKLDGLPLYVNFGTPTATVFAAWTNRAMPVWGLLAIIGLFSALSAGRLRQRMAQRFALEIARRRVEAAEKLADERIHLMRETNHRVKNNLSLIVSLINMQMRGKAGIDGNELKTRIGAISRVHDLMYRAADGVHVDFSETLQEIAASPAIVPREKGISVICEAEPGIVLGPETTTPLALIAAELLTNAVKHAFRDRAAGTIRVSLNRTGETGVMEVSDDGVGLPDPPPRRSGAAIIDALVHQIGGEITRISGAGSTGAGVRMQVSFPLPVI